MKCKKRLPVASVQLSVDSVSSGPPLHHHSKVVWWAGLRRSEWGVQLVPHCWTYSNTLQCQHWRKAAELHLCKVVCERCLDSLNFSSSFLFSKLLFKVFEQFSSSRWRYTPIHHVYCETGCWWWQTYTVITKHSSSGLFSPLLCIVLVLNLISSSRGKK